MTFKSQKDVNFRDPNYAVGLPVFIIHGNHDDPIRDGTQTALSALDIMQVWLRPSDGAVMYFAHILFSFAGIEFAELFRYDRDSEPNRYTPYFDDEGSNEGVSTKPLSYLHGVACGRQHIAFAHMSHLPKIQPDRALWPRKCVREHVGEFCLCGRVVVNSAATFVLAGGMSD